MTASSPQVTSGGPRVTSGGRDLLFMAAAATIALTVAVFNTLNVLDERERIGRPIPAWEPAVWEGTSVVVLLALLPAVLWVTRRAWPLTAPPTRWLGIHAATLLAMSLLHVLGMGALRGLIYRSLGDAYDPLLPLRDWPYELRQDLPVYAVLVALYVGWTALGQRKETGREPPEVLEVRDGARRRYVPLSDVLWVEAAGNYVELNRQAGPVLHRASLTELERQLAEAGFVRIHRSRLVRRDAVAEIASKPSGDFTVRLADGRELAGSRRYRRPLLDR